MVREVTSTSAEEPVVNDELKGCQLRRCQTYIGLVIR